jgi:acetyl-CoA acetyltransferase
MAARVLAAGLPTTSFFFLLTTLTSAQAEDLLKVAVAQRGQWDTAITELAERSGIFGKRGLTVEILYTQGGPEAHQAVISGSMDIACGGGADSDDVAQAFRNDVARRSGMMSPRCDASLADHFWQVIAGMVNPLMPCWHASAAGCGR